MTARRFVVKHGRVSIGALADEIQVSNAEAEVVAKHLGFLVHKNSAGNTFVSTHTYESQHPLKNN